MDEYTEGLRCQDVNTGLRTFDATSPVLTPVKKTRLVGMAADVAALVRDRQLIADMATLEAVAAAELDIPSTSFDGVIDLLEQAELVDLTRSTHGEVTGLTSRVPHYRDLYEILGSTWRNRRPSQLEEEVVAVVDRLARGPLPADSLVSDVGVEATDVERLMSLGTDSELIMAVSGSEGTILYSPFTAFENPALLNKLAEKHGHDQMLDEFSALRDHQGLAVTSEQYPMLHDAIARGLIMAPSVELPGGGPKQPFASLPYTLDRELLVGTKPILDKALAVVACVRCGEQFGGYNALKSGVMAIDRLLRDGVLNPNSSHRRQYRLMRNKGIIAFGPDIVPGGKWVTPTLIDTPDNRKALQIARDLLALGESFSGREAEAARDLLSTDARYLSPMKTVKATKVRLGYKEREFADLIAAFMGYGPT
jgi:hypothetical protein